MQNENKTHKPDANHAPQAPSPQNQHILSNPNGNAIHKRCEIHKTDANQAPQSSNPSESANPIASEWQLHCISDLDNLATGRKTNLHSKYFTGNAMRRLTTRSRSRYGILLKNTPKEIAQRQRELNNNHNTLKPKTQQWTQNDSTLINVSQRLVAKQAKLHNHMPRACLKRIRKQQWHAMLHNSTPRAAMKRIRTQLLPTEISQIYQRKPPIIEPPVLETPQDFYE